MKAGSVEPKERGTGRLAVPETNQRMRPEQARPHGSTVNLSDAWQWMSHWIGTIFHWEPDQICQMHNQGT